MDWYEEYNSPCNICGEIGHDEDHCPNGVETTICSRCHEEYPVDEKECPSCGLARTGVLHG